MPQQNCCVLAREEEYTFSEMAVLVRDMERYAPLLEAAFESVRYRILHGPRREYCGHAAGEVYPACRRVVMTGFDRSEVLGALNAA